ncbi:MAG TPA: hypothetical protein VN766_20480 [Stellaceae bacterium]|nr:hypothetical protein [Stellaceae bacterium]
MSIDDRPGPVFGRRQIPSAVAPADPAAKPERIASRNARLLGLMSLFLAVLGAGVWTCLGILNLNTDSTRTEQKVIEIVNQPITHLPRSGLVGVFSPGWFHPGAIKPDFDRVDIHATQEFPYQGHVTSNLNPTEMFIGDELEFNSMTKYFYTDRTLPKKRLSDAEMNEINDLYRAIGRDGHALFTRWVMLGALMVVGCCLGLALCLPNRRSSRLPAR